MIHSVVFGTFPLIPLCRHLTHRLKIEYIEISQLRHMRSSKINNFFMIFIDDLSMNLVENVALAVQPLW